MSVARARELRRALTPAEASLWLRLRAPKPQGWRFRRQVPFRDDVLDLACFSHRLVVEVDGGGHTEPGQAAHDALRDAVLASQGFRTSRFTNTQVLTDIGSVLYAVTTHLSLPLVGRRDRPQAGGRGAASRAPEVAHVAVPPDPPRAASGDEAGEP